MMRSCRRNLAWLLCFGYLLTGCLSQSDRKRHRDRIVSSATNANYLFRDVTRQAGIRYRWKIEGKRPLNILQTIGNGCGFLDYDGDGNLDIVLVGSPCALYRGNGNGAFTDVSEQTGIGGLSGYFLGCAVGDYDNDGFPDVYLTGYRGGALLHNEGGRGFVAVTQKAGIGVQAFATAATFFDADSDGFLDLYIGNYVKFGSESLQRCRSARGILTGCSPSYYDAESGAFYRNRGNGTFEEQTGTFGFDRATGKCLGAAVLRSEGSVLLALANDNVPGDLFVQQRNTHPRYKNYGSLSGTAYGRDGATHAGMGIDWGDFDNDGKFDLFVATYRAEPKSLYHNRGNLLFEDVGSARDLTPAVPYVTFGAKFLDYDNDGFLDLLLANGHALDNIAESDPRTTYRQPSQLFRNERGTRFVEVSSQAEPQAMRPIVGRGVATGDYDNDGRIDALMVDSEGEPILLHNETPNAGNWVCVQLTGTKSNRDGIGAVITFQGKRSDGSSLRLVRHCHRDGSYMSASDNRLLCGIGDVAVVTVAIEWPSGQTERYGPLLVNRSYIFAEQKAARTPRNYR